MQGRRLGREDGIGTIEAEGLLGDALLHRLRRFEIFAVSWQELAVGRVVSDAVRCIIRCIARRSEVHAGLVDGFVAAFGSRLVGACFNAREQRFQPRNAIPIDHRSPRPLAIGEWLRPMAHPTTSIGERDPTHLR